MLYKNVVVTLANYLEVFKDFSPDVQDEVRSAILDNTEIARFIDICADDGFLLNQVRLAIREYVPNKYIKPNLGYRNLKVIRSLFHEGFNLSVLDKYIPKHKITQAWEESLYKILCAYKLGADISKVDFSIVPDANVELICTGLIQKYPMWLCVTPNVTLSTEMIRVLMKGMLLELDIHPFIDGTWTPDKVGLILSNASKLEYSVLLKHINSKFSMEQLQEIISVAKSFLDFLPLCIKDEDGYPLFNEYQMAVLGDVIRNDLDVTEFKNLELSDRQMQELFLERLQEKRKAEGRVLGGKLPKLGI